MIKKLKNQEKILLSLVVASFSFLLFGCSSTLKVYNTQPCIELTRGNASCFWSIDGPDSEISADIWSKKRIGRISLSPSDYGKMRKTIEKACLRQKCIIVLDDGTKIDALFFLDQISNKYYEHLKENDLNIESKEIYESNP